MTWRRASLVLERMLAALIWLHPATAAFFRSPAEEDVVSPSRAA